MMDSDFSDDSELLQLQAFPVDKLNKEINLSIPPTSGQEYLQRVQLEAKRCPAIVVANVAEQVARKRKLSETKYNGSSISALMKMPSTPAALLPSLQWQLAQLADFSDTRQKIEKIRCKIRQKHSKPSTALPNSDDAVGWCRLCFGSVQLSCSVKSENDETSNIASNPNNNVPNAMPPLLSIVGYMDQATIVNVLQYSVNWFEVTGFTNQLGCWLYALLACLEKPLTPESCSLLRTLTRQCVVIRSSLENKDDVRLIPLNLIICLVSRYFDQKDLADPS